MPNYHTQIQVEDRWAIAAYVRALQISRVADTNSASRTARWLDREANESWVHITLPRCLMSRCCCRATFIRKLPLIGGILAVLGIGGGLAVGGELKAFSYLTGYIFWLGVALGALFFVLVFNLARKLEHCSTARS